MRATDYQTPPDLNDLAVARRVYGDDYLREVFGLIAAAKYARPLDRKNIRLTPLETERLRQLVRDRGGAITRAISGKDRGTVGC